MGPESSGKTTVIYKMYGISGETGVGRCTRGVYGIIFPLKNVGVAKFVL